MIPGWAAGLTRGVPDWLDWPATVSGTVVVVKTVTVGVVALGAALVIGPGLATGTSPKIEPTRSRWPLWVTPFTDGACGLTVTVTVVVTGTTGLMTIVVTGWVVLREGLFTVVGTVFLAVVFVALFAVVLGVVLAGVFATELLTGVFGVVRGAVACGVVVGAGGGVVLGRLAAVLVAALPAVAGPEVTLPEVTAPEVMAPGVDPATGQGGSCCEVSRVITARASARVGTGMPAPT